MNTQVLKNRLIAGLILSAFIFLFIHSELDIIHPHSEDCAKSDLCLIVGTSRVDNDHKFELVKRIYTDYFAEILININRPSSLPSEKDYTSSPLIKNPRKKLYITNHALLI